MSEVSRNDPWVWLRGWAWGFALGFALAALVFP